ncbi:BRO family protein [Klebsiella variicola]|uniref:BRO-N domain-containing protein n=1 Tax=Klebsiella pneumoniae complex TaxID=3390273 RepID=UPI00101C792B|nr:hypothetical protein [Klebsiella pneumoniae]
MSTVFAFRETKFTPVKRNNQIWLTAVEIAQALGYKKSDAVTQIYDRNSDEFRNDMTLTLNLSVKGFGNGSSSKEVRVFSLRGAHLIAMFARTAIAKEFRRWVLDVLDREAGAIAEEPVKQKNRQCTAKQLTPLRQKAEHLITTGLGKIYPDIWKLVHQRFDVEHIHQLQPEQVGEAIEYLNVLEGEYLGKQAGSPAVSLNNDYSMGFFKPYLWIIKEKSIRAPWTYPSDLLIGNGDYPNPCGKLLAELKQQGYNVDAAQFQLMSLQHHLETHRSKIEAIQREIGGLGYR